MVFVPPFDGASVRMSSCVAGLLLCGTILVGDRTDARAQSKASAARDDTQIWSEVQFTTGLHERVDLRLHGHARLGRNVSDLVYERGGIDLAFKVHKYFSLGPGYWYVVAQPRPGLTQYENRPMLIATLRSPAVWGFTFSHRSQLERRFRDPANSTRYRSRLQLEHPLAIGSVKLKAFVSDELFYDWSVHGWVRNRFLVGAGKALSKSTALDVGYLRQNDGVSRPGDIHALQLILRIRH